MAKAKPPADPAKKHRPNAGKTDADVQEAVFAFYCVTQNYAKTSRKFNMPIGTVFGLVNGRAGGSERLEEIRNAMRADLIAKAYRAAGRMVPLVDPKFCGTVATSKTADASRAMESMVRSAHLMEPDATEQAAPTTINVFTGMAPPPELAEKGAAAFGPETTTTADSLMLERKT